APRSRISAAASAASPPPPAARWTSRRSAPSACCPAAETPEAAEAAVGAEAAAGGGGRLLDVLKPGFHCVRTHWIWGFMTFRRARRTRTVRLMVPTCPESGSGTHGLTLTPKDRH